MIIDLTHTLASGIPTFPGDPMLTIRPTAEIAIDSWYLQTLTLGEHTGTHIGVAAHMTEGGMTVEDLSPELLVRPAVVIDVREAISGYDDYLLDVKTIRHWENMHGMIEQGSVALLNTGWDHYWNHYEGYMGYWGEANSSNMGGELPFIFSYPGFSLEAARFLAEERGVVGLGIDTAGIDTSYSVNRYWLRGERYHLENLTHLENLPPRGATIFIGALPVENGSGSPVRVLAMVP